MNKFFEKVQLWHLLIVLIAEAAAIILTIGAAIEWKSNITEEVAKLQKQSEAHDSKLNELIITDEKVKQLNLRLDEVTKRLEDFNKEIIDIYKTKRSEI